MNEPLRPETLDELLSADLDGELTRAAADRGLSPAEARAAIATPAAVARRDALERTRAAVAPVPPLEPDVVDRLVTGALTQARLDNEQDAARRRHDRFDTARRLVVVAASVAAVFGGLALLVRAGGGSSASKASRAPENTEAEVAAPARPSTSGFGDVSTPRALRAAVLGRVQGLHASRPPAAFDAPRANGAAQQATSGSPRIAKRLDELTPRGPHGVQGQQRLGEAADGSILPGPATRSACLKRLAGESRPPREPLLSGTGVAQGRPVYVVVFGSTDGRYDVFVVGASDCSVVRHITVS